MEKKIIGGMAPEQLWLFWHPALEVHSHSEIEGSPQALSGL